MPIIRPGQVPRQLLQAAKGCVLLMHLDKAQAGLDRCLDAEGEPRTQEVGTYLFGRNVFKGNCDRY
jgi:hypothetical protein